jgi:glutaredoxin|tara:strand:+ start:998 stop:1237 length:240 start_codon:yes stop_codon:yes gene_type:complete
MNNFTVYTMDGCSYCEKVQEVLREADQKFVTYKIDKDFTRDSFYGEFGEGATFPQVVVDGNKIGGASATVKYLKENKLV